jgi:hypothetical protein
MQLFAHGFLSWKCSWGRVVGQRCEIYHMKNTITPHTHRSNQVNLIVACVGATEAIEGTKICQKVISLLILAVRSSLDKCDSRI